jgi:hypothetical protein
MPIRPQRRDTRHSGDITVLARNASGNGREKSNEEPSQQRTRIKDHQLKLTLGDDRLL